MPFVAKLTALRTRPYRAEELAQMEEEQRERYASGYYEKILGENVIEEFTDESLDELGKRVSEIAETQNTDPIILTTPQADELTMKHVFLTKRAYVRDDEKRVFELIVYRPKDHAAWQEKMNKAWKAARTAQPEPLSLEEREQFTQKAISSMVEKSVSMMPSMLETFAKQMGFMGYGEYSSFMATKKEGMTDEQFSEFFREFTSARQLDGRARRREELASKPPYEASFLPKLLNDEMTVICRIFGKDDILVYKHLEYYKTFHKLPEQVYSLDNSADDGTHVSFAYHKDADDPQS